jgi:homoserine O-succinyltransferase
MPVVLDSVVDPWGHWIEIGLVNNMPDAAREATERQFVSLLDAAAPDIPVRLRLYSVQAGTEDLWSSRLDGLIVTGTEPRQPSLPDEPYWDALTGILDWAEHSTVSSIWSCLAAHAAVLHMDRVERRPLAAKRSGVFDFSRMTKHPMSAGLPDRLRIPHSRWNDLPADALAACGYGILTHAAEAGVDAFVKERRSLLVFFQGHPEYEPDTLLREYRRDVARFLKGERDTYPDMPHGYFNATISDALTRFRALALAERSEALLASFPVRPGEQSLDHGWRDAAVDLYRNWLSHIMTERASRARSRRRAAFRAAEVTAK